MLSVFELFIALFGGLYIACRCAYDNSKSREADTRISTMNERRNAIENRYVADIETRERTKEYIRCGKHFEDICNTLCDDLRYALGNDWKNKLQIPKGYTPKNLAMYPDKHEYWIYHLLLAKQGKIDVFISTSGYGIGGIYSKDMCIKFAECIERELYAAGVHEIRLTLELDYLCVGLRRTPSDLCGGNIKIESLCHYPTHRLWADYIQK